MEEAKAFEDLENPEVGGRLNANDFYELCRKAGYSEEVSQKAATARANSILDRERNKTS
jgi:hypothetical protein